jgi:Domain of unknown function (DUF4440)
LFDLLRAAAAALLLFPIPSLASAQSRPTSVSATHHYDLADPALARAAQRYDWAQEGKGNRAELEKLVAVDYVLVRANGKVTNKAGLIDLICHPGGYTNPYIVEMPFVRDLGTTVILGGWVRLSGIDDGKPFEQKARFADLWHKGPKGWQLAFTQLTLADKP